MPVTGVKGTTNAIAQVLIAK
jgi:hypothetical protein